MRARRPITPTRRTTRIVLSTVVAVVSALLFVAAGNDVARSATAAVAPPWRILVLVYPKIDFAFQDASGPHHVVGAATDAERRAAVSAAKAFVLQDIPALDSGQMVPTVTVRIVDHALTNLDATGLEWWPSPAITAPDIDPAFDSVIVIWKSWGKDLVTGEDRPVNASAGLTPAMGTGQTYTTMILDAATSYGHRNVFKHEFGHSLLAYFEAARVAPEPAVSNHTSAETYVHYPTGAAYVWEDETSANPIPNSIYNNDSGFTHDYYSGTTATADQPTRCLGITAQAWAYGGPVTFVGLTPTQGYPGAAVSISGRGFADASRVTFNGTPASTFTVNSDAKITAYVPAAATTGRVGVTSPSGTFTSRSDFTTRPFAFAPQEGPTGTTVVLSGLGFRGASSVRFNGASASFTVNSDRKITAVVPRTATTGPISIVTASATLTSDSDFGVVPKIEITSISPNPFYPYQGQSTTITWSQDREAWIEVFAKDSARRDSWGYDEFDLLPAGTHSIVWDGKGYGDGAGYEGEDLVPDVYTVTIYATEPAGGSSTFTQAQVTLANVSSVPAPVATIVPEQTVSQGPPVTVLSDVTWSSAAPNVCSYRLQRSVNGASFADIALSRPTNTSVITPVAVGNSYRFRVRATFCDGTVGAWMTATPFTVRGFQQGAATYSKGWSSMSLAGSWGGSVKTTSTVGSEATFTFTGRAVSFVGTSGPGYGTSAVYVDGALFEGRIGSYGDNLNPSVIGVAARWPGTNGSHTLTIVDADGRIDVDGFIVFA